MAVNDFSYPEDFACQFAIKNMWANPQLNQQYQLRMSRISPPNGELDDFVYMGKYRQTPNSKTFYQIFSLGGYHPGFWGMFGQSIKTNPNDRWINLADVSNYKALQIDVYNSKGYIYPKDICWVLFSYDKFTLIAIEVDKRYETTKNMYLRCYTTDLNVVQGKEAIDNPEGYLSHHATFNGENSLGDMYAKYQDWSNGPGLTSVFVNGLLFPTFPSPSQLKIGDDVNLIHDPIVETIETYQLTNLENFYSELDKKRKYIIHPPMVLHDYNYRYYDDVDFYLVDADGFGLYFHRNNADAVRQLTHRDYAIASDYIDYLANQHPKLQKAKTDDTLRLKVFYRKTKWKFELQSETSRIHYLYHLDDNGIINAMAGVNSNLPIWQASNLERGFTNTLLKAKYQDINLELVRNALGYNGATLALSNSIHYLSYEKENAKHQVTLELPPSYRKAVTVYEYDKDGYFLTSYTANNKFSIAARNENCEMVELIAGIGGNKLNYVLSRESVPINTKRSYRVFVAGFSIDDNGPSGDWVDVTGTNKYHVRDGVLEWNFGGVASIGLILFNDQFISYETTLNRIDKSLEVAIIGDQEQSVLLNNIKLANVDLILNGKSLIENVDYQIDYPNIHIYNKQYLTPGSQKLLIRAYGLAPYDESPKFESELGFVIGGCIGYNDRYNLRDDRATKTVIAGKLFITKDVPNLELDNIGDKWDQLNGMPYGVKHLYIPNLYVKDGDDYYGYKDSRELDKKVCNYLTIYGHKTKVTVPETITDKYMLYSPMVNAVTMAIVNGIITIEDPIDGSFSQRYVADKIRDYLSWYNFDPYKLMMDERYITIHPHNSLEPITVQPKQFIFLKAINRYYYDNSLPIEGFYEVNNYV